MKVAVRDDAEKAGDLRKLPSEKQAHAEFKAKISTARYPLRRGECRSTILRAWAFAHNIDTMEKKLLRSRMTFRYECQKLGADIKNMERKAETEDTLIKKAKEDT